MLSITIYFPLLIQKQINLTEKKQLNVFYNKKMSPFNFTYISRVYCLSPTSVYY